MISETARFSSLASQASDVESLAQAARKKQLHIARNILILLGVVKIALNAYFFNEIDAKVKEAVQRQVLEARMRGKPMNDGEIAALAKRTETVEKIIWGGAGLLGVAFIVLGAFVKKYPVKITSLSLILYLTTTAIFGFLNPLSLMEILFFKLFAVAALVKSISAANAYQREEIASGRDADRFDNEWMRSRPICRDAPIEPSVEHKSVVVPSFARPCRQTPQPAANGLEIYSNAHSAKAAVVFGGLGVGLLVLGAIFHNAHLSLFALAPWMVAIGLWFFRPYVFRGELSEDGLFVENPPMKLSYSSIHNITLAGFTQDPHCGYLQTGPLAIVHAKGCVRIPDRLNVTPESLYRELFNRIPAGGSREVPDELIEYLHKEEALHGMNSVFTYCSRRLTNCGPATGHAQGRILLLTLCGILWTIIGGATLAFDKKEEFLPWIVFGIVLAVVSVLFFIVQLSKQGRPKRLPKKFQDAGLIVGPAGLCLRQGDLSGVLRWNELRQVVYRIAVKSFAISHAENNVVGLDLIVDGATIRLADIYDRPLPLIQAVIFYFWTSPQTARQAAENNH